MLKRPLVWLAAAFSVALLLLTNFSFANVILPVAAVGAAALALLRLVPPAVRGRALLVCVAVLLAWGAVTLNHSRLPTPMSWSLSPFLTTFLCPRGRWCGAPGSTEYFPRG